MFQGNMDDPDSPVPRTRGSGDGPSSTSPTTPAAYGMTLPTPCSWAFSTKKPGKPALESSLSWS